MDAQWAAVSAGDKAQCEREAQARNAEARGGGNRLAVKPAADPSKKPAAARKSGRQSTSPDAPETPAK